MGPFPVHNRAGFEKRGRSEHQQFTFAAGRLLPEKAGRNDAGIVHHEQGILRQKIRQMGEIRMHVPAGLPVQNKKAGRTTHFGRVLGNAFFGKFVIVACEEEVGF